MTLLICNKLLIWQNEKRNATKAPRHKEAQSETW
jgi:hypothetical protein